MAAFSNSLLPLVDVVDSLPAPIPGIETASATVREIGIVKEIVSGIATVMSALALSPTEVAMMIVQTGFDETGNLARLTEM